MGAHGMIRLSRQRLTKRFFVVYNLSCLPTKVGVHPRASCESRFSVFGETWMHADLCRSPGGASMETKQCKGCGEIKPLDDFYKTNSRGRSKQYYSGLCKRCYVDDAVLERLKQAKAEEQARAADLAQQGLKRCTKCDHVKPYSEFHKMARNADGFGPHCKDCSRERDRKYSQRPLVREARRASGLRYARSDKGIERARLYALSDEGRENRKLYSRSARSEGKWEMQRKARLYVFRQVRSGKFPHVSTRACADCGAQATQYHHESYERDRWLDVVPLCTKCHKARHMAGN